MCAGKPRSERGWGCGRFLPTVSVLLLCPTWRPMGSLPAPSSRLPPLPPVCWPHSLASFCSSVLACYRSSTFLVPMRVVAQREDDVQNRGRAGVSIETGHWDPAPHTSPVLSHVVKDTHACGLCLPASLASPAVRGRENARLPAETEEPGGKLASQSRPSREEGARRPGAGRTWFL